MVNEAINLYEIAHSLLPAARNWTRRHSSIPIDLVEDIMMDVVAYFLESKIDLASIQHPPAYLFKSFRRRVYEYMKKNIHPDQLDEINLEMLPANISNIENDILIDEILEHMDDKSRFIHDFLVRNYKYKEIVPEYNRKFNVNVKEDLLRSKYNKSLNKLVKLLGTK